MISMDQNICQKGVEEIEAQGNHLEGLRRNSKISMDRECIKDLSSRQRDQKKNLMDQPAFENLSKAKQRSLIEEDVSRYLLRNCRA